MTLIALVKVLTVLAACASAQQHNYVDYDYQTQGLSRAAAPSAGLARAAATVKPTPVPIIKQINRHNDDGSYTYGYEGADGSFKIETKLPTGEVSGKYGYVDDTGKLRVVDYGANRYGFQPAGEGITVAPPTLVDETTDKTKEHSFADYDDGVLFAGPPPQAVPRPVARQQKRPRPAPRPVQFVPQPQPQPQHQFVSFDVSARAAAPLPTPVPVQHVQAVPQLPPQFAQQQQVPQQFFAFEQPRSVAAAPRVAHAPAPSPAPVHVPAPVPARAVVPGAAPSAPLFRPHALPAPVPASARPAPVREHHARASGSTGSVLDSLIQQYALPQGVGQPLHDISFGSYSSSTNF